MLVAKKKSRYDSELTNGRERVCARGRKRGGKRGTECANRRSEGRDFSEKVADTNRRSIEAFGETTTRVCVCVWSSTNRFSFQSRYCYQRTLISAVHVEFLASLCSKVLTSAGFFYVYFSFVLVVAILINLQLMSARYR